MDIEIVDAKIVSEKISVTYHQNMPDPNSDNPPYPIGTEMEFGNLKQFIKWLCEQWEKGNKIVMKKEG